MDTFKRICLQDYEVVGRNGTFKIERGKEYLTSDINITPDIEAKPARDHVIVFSNFWVLVPVSMFGGEIKFT